MERDDPEQRIADLERRLAEARAAGDPSANQGFQVPPPWTPFPAESAGEPFPPPPVDWQNPAPPGPYPFSFPAGPGSPTGKPAARISWILPAVAVSILLVVIVGIVAVPAFLHQAAKPLAGTAPPAQHSTGSPTAAAGPPPSTAGSQPATAGPTRFLTADGLNGLFAQVRSKFGDTMGFELTVYPDYAVLERADPQNRHHKNTYVYRDGSWSQTGATEHTSSFDSLVDLGKLDVVAVAAKIAGAAQPLNVPNPTTTYAIVEGSQDGTTEIDIHVSGNGDSGYLAVNPDGSIKKAHPQT
jgi:serine/threonine-protein kinase